jgi:hypothetical protein
VPTVGRLQLEAAARHCCRVHMGRLRSQKCCMAMSVRGGGKGGGMHLKTNVLRGSVCWAAHRRSVCLACGQPVTTAAARKHTHVDADGRPTGAGGCSLISFLWSESLGMPCHVLSAMQYVEACWCCLLSMPAAVPDGLASSGSQRLLNPIMPLPNMGPQCGMPWGMYRSRTSRCCQLWPGPCHACEFL